MKKYKKFLIILCCIILVLAILPTIVFQIGLASRKMKVGDRNNSVCTTERRVFDYADVLTDRQEKKLQNLIERRQKQLGLDIVIVTIDENVGSDPYNASVNKTIDFAQDFYRYFEFGYDGPTGSGVIYVDNWYDLAGYAESAFQAHESATGSSIYNKAFKLYKNESILLELENDVWEYSNVNPYLSYRRLINHLSADMVGMNFFEFHLKDVWTIFIPFLVALIFVLANLGKKLGKKTTNANTYVEGGHADIKARRDIFLSKHTTSRHIESSSGGGHSHSHGGGGGGFSGGGGRH